MRRIIWPLFSIAFLALLFYPWPGFPPLASLLLYPSSPLQIDYRGDDKILHNSPYPGLELHYDQRGVPHIFADSDPAMAYAMGYTHAEDRAFQLEMLRRTVRGRLSEVVGARALPSDRFWLKFDFESLAQLQYAEMQRAEPELTAIFEAYSAGFNDRIAALGEGSKALEFHLLGFEPSPMQPYAPLMLIRYMDKVLNYNENNLKFSALAQYLPDSLIDFYYPWQAPYSQFPIYPELSPGDSLFGKSGHSAPHSDRSAANFYETHSNFAQAQTRRGGQNELGSNNWAVAAKKSKSGNAFLCNDTHLPLKLPGTWYEVHQVVGGRAVHGMSIPGSPFVIAGYSADLAWGMTNATWNLCEFYALNTNGKGQYKLDGEWIDWRVREVKIPVKGEEARKVQFFDTYFGPTDTLGEEMLATQWVASLEERNEMKAFYSLYRARSVEEGYKALQNFGHPPQNFVLADKKGHIGMVTAGFSLQHSRPRRGIVKASHRSDRSEYVYMGRRLQVLHPHKGWNQSSNHQQLSDSLTPYLNTLFSPTARGRRISAMLQSEEKIDRDYLKKMHGDVLDGEWTLLRKLVLQTAPEELIGFLQDWQGYCTEESVAATLYNHFKWGLQMRTSAALNIAPLQFEVPGEHLFHLLSTRDSLPLPGGAYLSVNELARTQWEASLEDLRERFGPEPKKWHYGRYHQIYLEHIAKIDAFSHPAFPAKGSSRTVRVSTGLPGTHGPSKRIVVEMTPQGPVGETVLAGGQSGQPGHPHYDDQIAPWYQEEYFEVPWVLSPQNENWSRSLKFQ